MTIRGAHPADAAAIATIYNQAIAERGATFETRDRDPSEFAEQIDAGVPLLVATRGSRVLGWAALYPYSDRPCYAGVREASIYVERAFRNAGLGSALMDGLARAADARGFWKMIGKLFPENSASVRLCERNGWRRVGTFERHGELDGKWRDVLLVERLLPRAGGKGEPS